MPDDLILAIRLVENIKISNTNFSSTYMFSNENINGFIKKISLNKKNALTVCSSGDQAFNLVLNGAYKVDLFDINGFTKYYFYFKKAAIMGLSYQEFINFFFPTLFNKNVFNFDSYLNLRNKIDDDEVRVFWDYLFCHYSGIDLYNSKLFHKLYYSKKNILKINEYLINEDNYNRLKELLINKQFNFYNINLFDDSLYFNDKYDFVYLSNIFDYLFSNSELEYAKSIKKIIANLSNYTNDGGDIAVNYIYLYNEDYDKDSYFSNFNSLCFRNEYFDANYEYVIFSGAFDPDGHQSRNKDALMLYRKRN